MARTYWRWQLTWNPLEWYQPASSAVGMYQITDGTFTEAKRYCIHDHVVVEDGPWHNWQSCWFNSLYTRVLPSHAIELTAALLDRQVIQAIGPRRMGTASLQRKQNLAAVIHLCGAEGRPRLCCTQIPADPQPTVRRPRRERLPGTDQCVEVPEFAKPAAGDKTIRQAP